MLNASLIVLAVLSTFYGNAPASAQDESTTVEVFFAAENVPAGLKAGDKVSLHRLDGRSVTPSGKVSQTTTMLVPNAEVVSVKTVEKPKTPDLAVKIELRVKKSQARIVERAKTQLVNVMETSSGGNTKVVKKPVTLLLMVNQ